MFEEVDRIMGMVEIRRKIYEDKDLFVRDRIEILKRNLEENIGRLPSENLPFMEPHLRSLYFQTYFLLAQGDYNAGVVLCGILLENIAKEKLFMEGITDEKLEGMDFGNTITELRRMGVLTEGEIKFLDIKRDSMRNPYAHYNIKKLTKGMKYEVAPIPNFLEKFKRVYEAVENGEMTEEQARMELIKGAVPELKDSSEFRPLAQIAKSQKDEEEAIPVFLEVDKFVREFAEKYFKPKE